MATTNHEYVGKGLQLLRDGLAPFVQSAVRAAVLAHKVGIEDIRRCAGDPRQAHRPIDKWDVAALLKVMWDRWNEVFRQQLGRTERSLVSELRDWRNKWAHQECFTRDDAYRALDSAERLLAAIAAPQAHAVACLKRELLAPRNAAKRRPPPPSSPKSQADRIREHVLRQYVEPWRRTGKVRLCIRAGDVQREMGLRGAAPNVCNVLRGEKFLELANVKLVHHTEPCPSTTTHFHYERG